MERIYLDDIDLCERIRLKWILKKWVNPYPANVENMVSS